MAPNRQKMLKGTLVIALLLQGCNAQGSQSECSSNLETCIYNCSASELHFLNCSLNMGTKYNATLVAGQAYCCPSYFLTLRRDNICQKCQDIKFMPNVNKCCHCKACKECEEPINNTIKEQCTHHSNTVCSIETDPPPVQVSICPTEEPPALLETTTATPKEVTTGASLLNSSFNTPLESKSDFTSLEIGLLIGFLLLIALVLIFCCTLCILAVREKGDEPDNANVTWTGALLPLARKMKSTVLCKDRCQGGGGGGGGGGDRDGGPVGGAVGGGDGGPVGGAVGGGDGSGDGGPVGGAVGGGDVGGKEREREACDEPDFEPGEKSLLTNERETKL